MSLAIVTSGVLDGIMGDLTEIHGLFGAELWNQDDGEEICVGVFSFLDWSSAHDHHFM